MYGYRPNQRCASVKEWLLCAALSLAAAALFIALTGNRSSSPDTSCTQIIHHYLHTTAQAAGVTLTHEHLIACHHTGDEATARVEFDVDIPGQPRQHEVLAVRLVKSAWWATDSHLVG